MTTSADSTPAPSRRDLLTTAAGAALTGAIIGVPVFRAKGLDLSAAAEGWLEDARDLGIRIIVGPDGDLWRVAPVNDAVERARARDAHWIALGNRPRLMRAVRSSVGRGFQP